MADQAPERSRHEWWQKRKTPEPLKRLRSKRETNLILSSGSLGATAPRQKELRSIAADLDSAVDCQTLARNGSIESSMKAALPKGIGCRTHDYFSTSA